MDPGDALEAVKMLKPGLVIPMHYNTFPLIEQDPLKFKSEVESNTTSKVAVIAPGDSLEF